MSSIEDFTEEKEIFTLNHIKEKRPDNPLFSDEKQKHQDYIDGLQQQVEFLRKKDPIKYMKYQDIGSSLMNCTYDPIVGNDLEGDIIKARELIKMVHDYNLENDLSKEEYNLLVKIYGNDWMMKKE